MSEFLLHSPYLIEILFHIQDCLKACVKSGSADKLVHLSKDRIKNLPEFPENEIKVIFDLVFREILFDYIIKNRGNDDFHWYDRLLEISIQAVRGGACTGNLPVNLFADLFESKKLDECEKLFELLEKRVDTWKEPLFFDQVKNQMLRCCNDLLRRLSKSQNTVFGGRILELLARFFPLFERSGLNLTSQFNLENTITIGLDEVDSSVGGDDVSMEDGEMSTTETIQVDYNLYRKFWYLQTFFRNPNSLNQKSNWKQFQAYSNDILSVLSTYKLDSSNSLDLKILENDSDLYEKYSEMHFTRYLTNQKLLELQLSDSSFRRYILIQFLVLFQYLQSPSRVRQDNFLISEDQLNWIKDTDDKILELIEETPPNGSAMRKCIEHALRRDAFWNNWKNENCPALKTVNDPAEVEFNMPPRERLGDELRRASEEGRVVIGGPELCKIWNLCPDNWEACLSKSRIFTPTLNRFFEEVISRFDSMSPEERKKMFAEKSDFVWRSLRLMSQKSQHFFTPSNQSVMKPITDYLDGAIEKVIKDLTAAADNNKNHQELAIQDAEDISNDELLKQVDENSNNGLSSEVPPGSREEEK